ncbi:hypothetical protein [Methanosarcina siciliae]|uniref:hypothetical protein n=1 Tax=Methanosarcina siciliae TaxID=38027 RepID=UPI00064F27AD|nr:hypothetical protein [Methanosarcina siciliae]
MPDSTIDKQREIEISLFEEYNKMYERAFSLIKFIFFLITFYISILVFTNNKIDVIANKPYFTIGSLAFSLVFLAISIFSLTAPTVAFFMSKFIKAGNFMDGHFITFREGDELKEHNRKMYSWLGNFTVIYYMSNLLILISIMSFGNYFMESKIIFFLIGVICAVSILTCILYCHACARCGNETEFLLTHL